jgi:hypothetical protein
MSIRINNSTYVLLLGVLLFTLKTSALAQTKENFGWVEKVLLYPDGLPLQAKLDTGADNSSLDASDVESFEKNGVEWVRFQIRNRYGQKISFEKEVRRVAMIKRHSSKHQRRKVIRVGVCLGKTYLETDVNLVDRTNFAYQMLLGRTFLAGNAIVDPSLTYTTEPNCEPPLPEKIIEPENLIEEDLEAPSTGDAETEGKVAEKKKKESTAEDAQKERSEPKVKKRPESKK